MVLMSLLSRLFGQKSAISYDSCIAKTKENVHYKFDIAMWKERG